MSSIFLFELHLLAIELLILKTPLMLLNCMIFCAIIKISLKKTLCLIIPRLECSATPLTPAMPLTATEAALPTARCSPSAARSSGTEVIPLVSAEQETAVAREFLPKIADGRESGKCYTPWFEGGSGCLYG
jgi:hypothetical protein